MTARTMFAGKRFEIAYVDRKTNTTQYERGVIPADMNLWRIVVKGINAWLGDILHVNIYESNPHIATCLELYGTSSAYVGVYKGDDCYDSDRGRGYWIKGTTHLTYRSC